MIHYLSHLKNIQGLILMLNSIGFLEPQTTSNNCSTAPLSRKPCIHPVVMLCTLYHSSTATIGKTFPSQFCICPLHKISLPASLASLSFRIRLTSVLGLSKFSSLLPLNILAISVGLSPQSPSVISSRSFP